MPDTQTKGNHPGLASTPFVIFRPAFTRATGRVREPSAIAGVPAGRKMHEGRAGTSDAIQPCRRVLFPRCDPDPSI